MQALCKQIVENGCKKYGMKMGIVSRIEGQNYEIIEVCSTTGVPHAGDIMQLNAVYCREVFETGKSVAITQIDGQKGMGLHPLYQYIPCEAYLSSPIIVNNKVWGTLNFTSFNYPFISKTVFVLYFSMNHISNSFNTSMWMPRKSCNIIFRIIRMEII